VDQKRWLSLVAVDVATGLGPVELRGEAAWARVNVPEDLSELMGARQWGVYLDAVVPVWHPRIHGLPNPVVSAGVRVERVDWNQGTFRSTGFPIRDDLDALVLSLSFRPVAGTVFRANYRWESYRDPQGNLPSRTGGIQVGFATYF